MTLLLPACGQRSSEPPHLSGSPVSENSRKAEWGTPPADFSGWKGWQDDPSEHRDLTLNEVKKWAGAGCVLSLTQTVPESEQIQRGPKPSAAPCKVVAIIDGSSRRRFEFLQMTSESKHGAMLRISTDKGWFSRTISPQEWEALLRPIEAIPRE